MPHLSFARRVKHTRQLVEATRRYAKGTCQRGQMVVEYVLLMMVSVLVATLLVRLMVSRSPDDPGIVIQKWRQLIEFVATDQPEGS